MEKECCETCRYCKMGVETIYDDPNEPWRGRIKIEIWLCKRYPPKRINNTHTIVFQHTYPDEWCGEYKKG